MTKNAASFKNFTKFDIESNSKLNFQPVIAFIGLPSTKLVLNVAQNDEPKYLPNPSVKMYLERPQTFFRVRGRARTYFLPKKQQKRYYFSQKSQETYCFWPARGGNSPS
jgi:hypothetical protein